MGRLTLNILLSFAQFEREIISERTKDKMGAARKKGRWLGGVTVLGYDRDAVTKQLNINPEESKLVREIFELYITRRSTIATAAELNARGILTKKHAISGGRPYGKAEICRLIANPIYIGKISYEGSSYDGIHEAIIPVELFERAQELLKNNRVRRHNPNNSHSASLLRHLLYCARCGHRMAPTYSSKRNIKYRYYKCQTVNETGQSACQARSVNAQAMDNAVIAKVTEIISTSPEYKNKNLAINTPVWQAIFPQERRRVLNLLVKKIDYDGTGVKLAIEMNDEGIVSLEKELCATNLKLN